MDLYSPKKASWLWTLPLFASVVFIIIFHLCLLMPGLDAGIQLYGGMLINKGYEPHGHLVNNKPTLIYLISAAGFFYKSNPFLGLRIIELLLFVIDLLLLRGIAKQAGLKNPVFYLLSFCAIYLVSWDEGALPEVFTIPLALLTGYLFLKRVRYFEMLASLLLLVSFLLKQNAFGVIGGVIFIDIFSQYRAHFLVRKMFRYVLSLLAFSFAWYGIMKASGAWNEFWYQAIVYNILYADRLPLFTALVNHILHNSFLSVRGVSLVMLFNIYVLISVYQFFKRYRQEISFSFQERFMLCALLVYIPAYLLAYVSGKSHPHYFLLLIVPASFLLAIYLPGKIVVMLLLAYGVYTNLGAISYNRLVYKSAREVAGFLKKNTSPEERVHIAGAGSQYIYVMAGRLSHTRFIVPLFEDDGYRRKDKVQLDRDFADNLPKLIAVRQGALQAGENYYWVKMRAALQKYTSAWENDRFTIYTLNPATH